MVRIAQRRVVGSKLGKKGLPRGSKQGWRKLERSRLLTEYKPISDYGVIGDLRTCALVGVDASIDWLCLPRFDSPSVFASILDMKKGGSFRIAPNVNRFSCRQYYVELTNILVTEFRTNHGLVRITDFMPCFKAAGATVSSGEIHRRITCLAGTQSLEIRLAPRFNYGAAVPLVDRVKGLGYSFSSKDPNARQALALLTSLDFEASEEGTVERVLSLKENQVVDLVLRYGGAKPHHSTNTYTDVKLRETEKFWKKWVSGCKYDGRWREKVLRSALALRLLVYEPTGAIIAAPTTSLPEEIGGVRNWDYRYSWIRDSSFVLWALHSLNHKKEAQKYLGWITSIFYLTGGNLQIMLGIGGERDLSESELTDLSGYRGSQPVRVGNGAWDQFQLDVYGILLDALYFSHRHGGGIEKKVFKNLVVPLLEAVEEDWVKPDCGIWEVRGKTEHFVYSKMWCWVAVDRALKIAQAIGFNEKLDKWKKLRDTIRADILDRGWDESLQSFVRSYGSKQLDAANLLMPQVGFINARNPKMLSTMKRTVAELLVDQKFLYRYTSKDGLPGKEGAFLICSFWLVNCLTMAGELGRAKVLMDSLLQHTNHLGLFSEEVDPRSGVFLGNFPQAFTHMGLITAATALNKALTEKVSDTA
jgi:GH15 family glucan-1,4-alpha-glucosidase